MRRCKTCGVELPPQHWGRPRIYCSSKCQLAPDAVERDCLHCGEPFAAYKTAGARPRYCSDRCRDKAARFRPPPAKRPAKSNCPTCGSEFQVIAPRQEYCSRLCNPKYSATCTRCGARKFRTAHALANPEAPYICRDCRGYKPPLPPETNYCLNCGKEFMRRGGGLFCGQACAYKHAQVHERKLPRPSKKRTRPTATVRPWVDGIPVIGPGRVRYVSVHENRQVTCPGCVDRLDLNFGSVAWCLRCQLEVEMARPQTPVRATKVPSAMVDRRKRLEALRDLLEARINHEDLADRDLASLAARYQSVLAELAALPEVSKTDSVDEVAARRAARRAAASDS